jgi:PKD repeat protein
VLALVCAVLPGVWVAATAAGGEAAGAGRTWVVDAVDSTSSNTWQSVDTGDSVVTINVGDTVEWQFDRATMGHDLTSVDSFPGDPYATPWQTPLLVHKEANEAPVSVTFDQPGTYHYKCSLHDTMMTGIVIVRAAGGNQPPTAEPVVEPTSGPAPLVVHATANASDPDGDLPTSTWDFGTGAAVTRGNHTMFEYTQPGSYVVRLRVSDGRGGLYAKEWPITVTSGGGPTDPEPPADDGELPAIDALATAGPGTALGVAFSTQVTTHGTVHSYSYGLTDYPDLTGEATIVRSRARTTTMLSVTGVKPSARHAAVHVHEKACDVDLGGPHFRFDTSQAFAEPNEIWPLFTSDASGSSGLVEVTKPIRAGSDAVSVVVHDPDNAAKRIGCADLAPSTSDLVYVWSFGDGTTGTGADPDHTYAAPGTYMATVTVTHGSGPHAGHTSVSDSVRVTVGGGTPAPPAPPVDRTPPRISQVGPVRTVRSARPTIKARVLDRGSRISKKAIVLRVDGRKATGMRYDAKRGKLAWRPTKALASGRHVVRLVVKDAAGNKASKTWWFKVVRRP